MTGVRGVSSEPVLMQKARSAYARTLRKGALSGVHASDHCSPPFLMLSGEQGFCLPVPRDKAIAKAHLRCALANWVLKEEDTGWFADQLYSSLTEHQRPTIIPCCPVGRVARGTRKAGQAFSDSHAG